MLVMPIAVGWFRLPTPIIGAADVSSKQFTPIEPEDCHSAQMFDHDASHP